MSYTNRIILHIDFNSYFATVEQQANPRLRGKPIGVTGGDRMQRTVLGATSVEAKRYGVKTGMRIPEALALCPKLILVQGDSDKYLECTKRFLNILKDYSPFLEVFSIDECFLDLPARGPVPPVGGPPLALLSFAQEIKNRIKSEVGEWITCSIGISYNKVIAKLAGSLYKPDGLVTIADEKAAMTILDQVELDEICGIGPRIKKRLNNMGIFGFGDLRQVPLECLLASFKSYGNFLYEICRGVNHSEIIPFYEKEEVKSIGHRHTLSHNTADTEEIKQLLLKLTELVARRLRAKKLIGKTVSFWYRSTDFLGDGGQITCTYTNDGLDIFKAAWKLFNKLWNSDKKIRMIGTSISNLKTSKPENLTFLEDIKRREIITQALDKINDKYGEFVLQRGTLLKSAAIRRKPNPFLSDRRFQI